MDAELVLDLLDAARAGDTDAFVSFFGSHPAVDFLQIRDEYSQSTPLHMAAANGHAELLALLLKSLGIDLAREAVNSRNDSGNTPLLWAALTGSQDCAKLLVEAGADVLARNNAGVDSIAQAVRSGHDDVADFLYSKVDIPENATEEDATE